MNQYLFKGVNIDSGRGFGIGSFPFSEKYAQSSKIKIHISYN